MVDYSDFFEQVTGFRPFPFQKRFGLSEPSDSTLIAPTGAGKTKAVVVRWLWRHTTGLPVANRLVIMEPMRVLVNQVLAECRGLVNAADLTIPVHQMLGGDIDNSWINTPEKPAIIVGTQDQILSRSLMRGYACSRWSWPQHFALLHNDCEYFIDETQLMGPGYSTTAQLNAFRRELQNFGNVTCTWSSATLDSKPLNTEGLTLNEFGLDEHDRVHPTLGQRIGRPKGLHQTQTTLGDDVGLFARQLAQEVSNAHESNSLSLVIVSQVDRALAIYQNLQASGIPIRLLHSRYRRVDREQLTNGLSDFQGIVVSTQVVEAGVDLDSQHLWTDLCSWASFVQRAGRCGRGDTPSAANLHWIDMEPNRGNCLPYTVKEVEFTRGQLTQLTDVSIQTLLTIKAPPQPITGERLTQDKLLKLFNTHPPADGQDIDIARHIRDSNDRTVSVAWFDGDTPPDDWMPGDNETCQIPLAKFSDFTGYRWNIFDETWELTSTPRPNDVIVLPCSAGGYSALMGWTGNPNDSPVALPVSTKRDRYGADNSSYIPTEVTLTQHSQDTWEEVNRILAAMQFQLPQELPQLGRLHDWGKAHPVFQAAMDKSSDSDILAKGTFARRYQRPGFRHELASAIAALNQGMPFIVAYLLAAHHGKVRCDISPMPWERRKDGYRGVMDGDILPDVDLGNGTVGAISLSIDPSDPIGWWRSECRDLLKALGPFRLAYLETMIRAADGAASRRYRCESF